MNSIITLALIGLTAAGRGASTQELAVAPFTATYSVEYRGIRAGTLDFILRKENGSYVYESIAHPRGLARLFVNNHFREASVFTLVGGRITPQRYELDDGSPATAEDTWLKFDWPIGKANGVHEDHPLELVLTPGVQDRMSVQVLVMQLLSTGKEPGTISFIDRDTVKEYRYTRVRAEKLKTALGEFDTLVYTSSRPGSNRASRLWYAPALGYVPVRGEQERKGKVETVFAIQALKR